MNPKEAFHARAEALLRIQAYGRDVHAVEAMDFRGARRAAAYAWPKNAVVATVYEFESYDAAVAAEQHLRKNMEANQQMASTVNGGLLLWAVAETPTRASNELLSSLVSSFAGEE